MTKVGFDLVYEREIVLSELPVLNQSSSYLNYDCSPNMNISARHEEVAS